MIQRIQTIFLILAAVANLAIFAAPLWQYKLDTNTETIEGLGIEADFAAAEDQAQLFTENPFHIALFSFISLSSVLLIIIIFLFNDRKKQIRWAYWGIILLFIEILSIILLSRNGPFFLAGREEGLEVQWGFALPVLAVIFVWLAIKRIQADEDLVRSMDRLR